MVTGGTLTTSEHRSSVAGSKTSQREAWDSYGYDRPPSPVPVVSHRPGIDSLPAPKGSDTVLFGTDHGFGGYTRIRESHVNRK